MATKQVNTGRGIATVETPETYKLFDREVGTVIAALRLWQDRDDFYTSGRAEMLLPVATNDGEFQELTGGGIDRLIDKLQGEG